MKTRLPGKFLLSPLISLLCTGCLGYSLDTPETVEVENPIPLSDHQFDANWGGPSRWACESQSASFSPLSKDYFLNAWGEPKEKIISVNGETWVYEESGRWCGLWLGYIIPIPLVLPVWSRTGMSIYIVPKFAPGKKFASVGYGGYVACYYKSIIYRTDRRLCGIN